MKIKKGSFYTKIIKRCFDFVLALFMLILLLPVLIIVACIIKFDSPGSIFFRQIRAGKNRVPFHIFKFRTMVVNAPDIGPTSTQSNDPRITKVGVFLRKSSIDEIPQIFNILIGQMSFIGPRPDLYNDVGEESEIYLKRFMVLPGISGLAQVNGRSSIAKEKREYWDAYYIDNVSFVLDVRIILLTIKTVFSKANIN